MLAEPPVHPRDSQMNVAELSEKTDCPRAGGDLGRMSEPFRSFKNLARDHPSGGDDVYPVPAFAAHGRGSTARAQNPSLP